MTALGAMRATIPGLAAEKGWPEQRFRDAIDDAIRDGLLVVNEKSCFLAVKNFLKYNEPEGPNSVSKAWVEALDLIPECEERRDLIRHAGTYLDQRSEEFKAAVYKSNPTIFTIFDVIVDAKPDDKPDAMPDPGAGAGTGTGTGKKESPKPRSASAEPRTDPAYELFCQAHQETLDALYQPKKGDFVQLAELRKTYKVGSKELPPHWKEAVANFFRSALTHYALADLSARYAMFRNGPVDRFGRLGGENAQRKGKVERTIENAQRLRDRFRAQDQRGDECGAERGDASDLRRAVGEVVSGAAGPSHHQHD